MCKREWYAPVLHVRSWQRVMASNTVAQNGRVVTRLDLINFRCALCSFRLSGRFVDSTLERLSRRLDCVRTNGERLGGLPLGGRPPFGYAQGRLRAAPTPLTVVLDSTTEGPIHDFHGVRVVDNGARILKEEFTLHRGQEGWWGETSADYASVERALRWIVATELLGTNGLLLHAATVVVGQTAHAFLGKSEAGKSTTAQEVRSDAVHSDELSILAPGQDGQWASWPSPFWGLDREGYTSQAAPLGAIWLLDGFGETRSGPVMGADAAMGIYARMLMDLGAIPGFSGKIFDIIENLLSAVPVFRLSRRRGDDLDSLLRQFHDR